MQRKLTYLLTALLLSFFAVQCDSISDSGTGEISPGENQEEELEKPELFSPSNGAENQSTTVELTWKKIRGGKEYQILISENENFDSTVIDHITEGTSYKTDSLSAGISYYWKVQPIKNNNVGPWSDVWQFTTSAEELDPVTVDLQSPENEAQVSNENVSFAWNPVSEANKYHYQISLDTDFTETVEDTLVESASIEIAELNGEQDYFWRVSPILDSAPSEWSEVWQITTEAGQTTEPQPEPGTPAATLVAPSDGSTNSNPLDLEWEAISGISEYQVQVSTDESFTSSFADEIVQGTTFEVDGTDEGQTYYWRVQATGDNDSENWSSVWSFDTETVKTEPAPGNSSFVSTQGDDFYVDGRTFRYAGTNAYYLPVYENIEPAAVDRAFNAFENAGISVVRMWGFYDGPAEWNGDAPLQPEAGVYHEGNLKLLDKVIAQGKEKGIRFIVTLANYYPELGGICQYNKWAGIPEEQACNSEGGSMELFLNGSQQQKWYKDYIKMLLNRVNTETGVAYKDEPAIFSWEIMNEGRNPGGDPQKLRDWYQEIAQYIKSIDPNHMVSTGEEGFENGTPSEYSLDQYSNTYILRANQGTSYLLNTAIPEIDYASSHWYPSGWGWNNVSEWGQNPSNDQALLDAQRAWLSDHANIAESMGKPFLLGEYGYSGWGDERVENIYADLWKHAENIQLDGSLIWQLTADHVKCYEYGGNICWPGGRADETLYNGFKNHIQAMESQ